MSTTIASQELAIWRRVIRPETAGWTPAGAEAILHLDFQADDHERMAELLERAKEGALSDDEAAELENYRPDRPMWTRPDTGSSPVYVGPRFSAVGVRSGGEN